MRGLTIVGAILLVLGVGALAFGHFTYTETKPVLKAGPIEVDSHEDHTISVPPIGGVILLLTGVGLIVVGQRRS